MIIIFKYCNNHCANIQLTFLNPQPSSPITEEETVDDIRENAPRLFSSQQRLVSIVDYESYLKKNFTNKDCNFYLNDQSYAVMDASWIKTECYKAYRKWLGLAGINKWKTNWDCDNFAQSFKMYENLHHARANPETLTSKHKSGKKNACDAHAAGDKYFIKTPIDLLMQ